MGKEILWLVALLAVTVGCADTWGRESAVEVPLHRDLMGLADSPPCRLNAEEKKNFCEGKGPHPDCPQGCREPAPQGQKQ